MKNDKTKPKEQVQKPTDGARWEKEIDDLYTNLERDDEKEKEEGDKNK